MFSCDPIGIIDSGLGGVSVYKELKKLLPGENFLYLADIKNAPYGEKTEREVKTYMKQNAEFLIRLGCKAIVIACNTATAVAVEYLRSIFDIKIFGVEPAVKPAVLNSSVKNVLVLSTSLTSKLEYFKALIDRYRSLKDVNIICVPVQELVVFVENGCAESSEITDKLRSCFRPFRSVRFDACVLGCTHFPFAKDQIAQALGYEVLFFDGAKGTAENVKKYLCSNSLINEDGECAYVEWIGLGIKKHQIINNKYLK